MSEEQKVLNAVLDQVVAAFDKAREDALVQGVGVLFVAQDGSVKRVTLEYAKENIDFMIRMLAPATLPGRPDRLLARPEPGWVDHPPGDECYYGAGGLDRE